MQWAPTKLKFFLLNSMLFLSVSASSYADYFSSREMFDAYTNSSFYIEDFEALAVSNGSYIQTGRVLDASTGEGSLVGDEIVFTSIDSNVPVWEIQWQGVGYYGQTSQNISAVGGTLNIDFLTSVNTVGFDLGVMTGYPESASIIFYGADDATILGSLSGIDLGSVGGMGTFIGAYNMGQIGSLDITGSQNYWSPLVDNVAYTNVSQVPIPAAAWFFGSALIGLAGIKRKK